MNDILPWLTWIGTLLGIVLTILKIIEVILKLVAHSATRRLSSSLAAVFRPWVAWGGLGIISIVCLILLLSRPSGNRLITYYDFESSDDDWSSVDSIKYVKGSNTDRESEFSDENSAFPGSIESELSAEHALTGRRSLKVTTSVRGEGRFKSLLYRKGTITAHGATIYVLAPEMSDMNQIDYVQLCVSSNDWVCSEATDIVAGEWTPVTIDMSQEDASKIALYDQKLTELAVQWVFNASASTSLDLYLDSAEVFLSGN